LARTAAILGALWTAVRRDARVNLALCLPLAPLAGLAAALVALSIGHAASVNERREQTRWRFSTGVSFGSGIIQVLIMALFAASTVYASPFMLAPCIAIYTWSTWWYGRVAMPLLDASRW
jgi:formate/nitrite transporter FocA (FNT family)